MSNVIQLLHVKTQIRLDADGVIHLRIEGLDEPITIYPQDREYAVFRTVIDSSPDTVDE